MVAQDSVYETFDTDPHPGDWLFWPGGHSERYCDLNTRQVLYQLLFCLLNILQDQVYLFFTIYNSTMLKINRSIRQFKARKKINVILLV